MCAKKACDPKGFADGIIDVVLNVRDLSMSAGSRATQSWAVLDERALDRAQTQAAEPIEPRACVEFEP